MRKIFKYPLIGHGITVIEVPGAGKALYAGLDPGGNICVWVQVSGKAGEATTIMRFHVVFTGEEYNASVLKYVNSMIQGPFIFHVFQEN